MRTDPSEGQLQTDPFGALLGPGPEPHGRGQDRSSEIIDFHR